MTNITKDISNKLLKEPCVLFSPFIGELGWEIFHWSGYVRWFALHRSKKKLKTIISTRLSSYDLYANTDSIIKTFDIAGDYSKFIPNCYSGINVPPIINEIRKSLISEFNPSFIVEPTIYKHNKTLFKNPVDYDYAPREENKKIINNIIKNKPKTIIAITPRFRRDLDKQYSNANSKNRYKSRNYLTINQYEELFNHLKTLDATIFIIGKQRSIYLPKNLPDNFIHLQKYIYNNTSLIGLTVEALKLSKFHICPQTSTTILANLLKVTNIWYGYDFNRINKVENIYNNKNIYFHHSDLTIKKLMATIRAQLNM